MIRWPHYGVAIATALCLFVAHHAHAQPAHCSDGKQNGSETDQDCGGNCPPCGLGQGCSQHTDCTTAVCFGSQSCVSPCPGAADPVDCDGDGLSNILEDKNADGAVDSTETNPAAADTDNDGIDDGQEDANKNGVVDTGETDPRLWDTDGGGVNDGAEKAAGTDPLDPTDDFAVPDGGPLDGQPDLPPGDGPPREAGPDAVPPRDGGPDGPGPDGGADGTSHAEAGAEAGPPPADGRLSTDDLLLYGGGGCAGCTVSDAHDLSGGAVVVILLVLGLLWSRRGGRRKTSHAPLVLLVSLVAAPGVRAAEPLGPPIYLPVGTFRPAISTLNYFATESTNTLPSLVPSAALYLSYAHTPLQLHSRAQDRAVSDVVRYRVNMDLLVAMGVGHSLEVGLALPVTLSQDSDQSAVDLGVIESAVGPGVGDLRVVPKLRLFERGPFAVAAAMDLALPTGSHDALLGTSGVSFTPKVIIALAAGAVRAGFNIGFRIRNTQSVTVGPAQEQVTVNDDLVLSLAIGVSLVRDHLDLVLDSFMAMAFEEQDREEIPVELLGGLRYRLPWGFVASVAAGPGLSRGVGVPAFRLLAGLGYQYQPKPGTPPEKLPPEDRDGDGLADDEDGCPKEPEDKDNFEDSDGCPEPDNDGDGVLDGMDQCPLKPEDRDGYKDEDGCPEDDNDFDGLLDSADKCPVEPEDQDGFEDEDGCPDPDNDGDGIPDGKDRCPLERETVNQVDDEDGCPDQAVGPVQVRRDAIKVEPVFFATGKDVILKKSKPTLKLVAATLREHTWIKKVRIEGHTDDRGKPAFNTGLSQRRADSVMRVLIENGVGAARLEAQGYGSSRPITGNATRAERAQNRRVELVIVDPPPPK